MNIEQLYNIYLKHSSVQTDTRKLQKGDLFFALRGPNFDGNIFAQKALDTGAAYVIIDNKDFYIDSRTILVDDTLKALQDLALHHRQQFDIPFLAITGSNGKTTTKELINAVLSTSYKTYCTEGNLNNHIGVPLTILKIKKDAQIAVIEMGANHQKEIESYCKYTLPTHGLINNCGKAHLEGFGGMEGVRKGKGELYDFIKSINGTIFRNVDLDYLQGMSIGIENQITYGTSSAHYTGTAVMNNSFINVAITTPRLETTIQSQLVGEYNFSNIMAAVAIGSHFKISIDIIKKAIEEYVPSNSRSQLIIKDSNTIILDAYNANPTSMQLAIQNFSNANYPNKILMLGGMWELGSESLTEHQNIIDLINKANWNAVVLVGGDFKKCKHNFIYFESSVDASEWLKENNFINTAILIKGSRATAMEKILN